MLVAIGINSFPIPVPQSVLVTIANGVITAMALLMTLIVPFLIQALPGTEEQKCDQLAILGRTIKINMLLLVILVLIGYRLVASTDAFYQQCAYWLFTDSFIIALTSDYILLSGPSRVIFTTQIKNQRKGWDKLFAGKEKERIEQEKAKHSTEAQPVSTKTDKPPSAEKQQ